MKTWYSLLGVVALVALVTTLTVALVSANSGSVIDFEDLTEGAIVSSVANGSGISGDTVLGSVSVFGKKTLVVGPNRAMIFDATCEPFGVAADCTGGDDDLFYPSHENILIISEDLNSGDPNDSATGELFEFDFVDIGSFIVKSIDVMDIETGQVASYEAFGESGCTDSLGGAPLPITGDNGEATVAVGIAGVKCLRVTMDGSGAIDNIYIDQEGCTPGYWKNHSDAPTKKSKGKQVDEWPAGFTHSDPFNHDHTFDGVDLPGITTLYDAITAKGGGTNKLARHGTAALLSAAHPDVDYPLTVAEVIAAVVAGDANKLAFFNERGCPL